MCSQELNLLPLPNKQKAFKMNGWACKKIKTKTHVFYKIIGCWSHWILWGYPQSANRKSILAPAKTFLRDGLKWVFFPDVEFRCWWRLQRSEFPSPSWPFVFPLASLMIRHFYNSATYWSSWVGDWLALTVNTIISVTLSVTVSSSLQCWLDSLVYCLLFSHSYFLCSTWPFQDHFPSTGTPEWCFPSTLFCWHKSSVHDGWVLEKNILCPAVK